MIKDFENSAKALYDGGWRAESKDFLKYTYELNDREVEIICRILAKIHEENGGGSNEKE